MTDKDLQRAKEIFFQHACNHFFIYHEGYEEEYRKLDISKAQEKAWTREYVSDGIRQLSVDDFHALNSLRDSDAGDALPEIFRMSTLGDSYTKLSFANTIWDIAQRGMMSPIMRERARRKAVSLWQSLLDNRIELTDRHRKEVLTATGSGVHPFSTTYQVLIPDDYILNYAKRKLKESKKRNGFYFLLMSLLLSSLGLVLEVIDWEDKVKRLGK